VVKAVAVVVVVVVVVVARPSLVGRVAERGAAGEAMVQQVEVQTRPWGRAISFLAPPRLERGPAAASWMGGAVATTVGVVANNQGTPPAAAAAAVVTGSSASQGARRPIWGRHWRRRWSLDCTSPTPPPPTGLLPRQAPAHDPHAPSAPRVCCHAPHPPPRRRRPPPVPSSSSSAVGVGSLRPPPRSLRVLVPLLQPPCSSRRRRHHPQRCQGWR